MPRVVETGRVRYIRIVSTCRVDLCASHEPFLFPMPRPRKAYALIPLRLSDDERLLLRVLESALAASEYTDKIDVAAAYSTRVQNMRQQLANTAAVLAGMFVVAAGKRGQELVQDRSINDYPELLGAIFEIGRRQKAMNPEQMRLSYGKLICMLQDAQSSEVHAPAGFERVAPIHTVADELAAIEAEELLEDDDIMEAVEADAPPPWWPGPSRAARVPPCWQSLKSGV